MPSSIIPFLEKYQLIAVDPVFMTQSMSSRITSKVQFYNLQIQD